MLDLKNTFEILSKYKPDKVSDKDKEKDKVKDSKVDKDKDKDKEKVRQDKVNWKDNLLKFFGGFSERTLNLDLSVKNYQTGGWS